MPLDLPAHCPILFPLPSATVLLLFGDPSHSSLGVLSGDQMLHEERWLGTGPRSLRITPVLANTLGIGFRPNLTGPGSLIFLARLCLGVIGQYLGKIYTVLNNKPTYSIKDQLL